MILLTSFIPEFLIVSAIFSLLTLDLFFLKAREPLVRTKLLGTIALLFVVAASLPLLKSSFQSIHALGGMWVLDPLVIFVKLVILAITFITILLSMEEAFTPHVSEYYALLLFACLGMLFLVSAEEFIMIYVALELLSVSLYILTALHHGVARSAEAAVKYFLFGALSSSFLYFGASYLYGLSGATNLTHLGAYFRTLPTSLGPEQSLVWVGVAFILVGLGFKLAVVPFHLWAPDAYEGAPTPVTAYISTGSKLASFFILVKVLLLSLAPVGGSPLCHHFQGGWESLLAILAVLSMTLGNLVAMTQKNLKRLLAYSSIAHAGYILVGVVAATRMGIASVFYYLAIYAFTNLGAFGVITAVAAKVGGDDLSDFSGIGKRSPLLSFLMVIFILSLAGIPPLAGFFGKFYLFLSAVGRDSERYGLMWLVVAGVANSAISLYYYLRILKQMYIVEPTNPEPLHASPSMMVALTLSALVVVGFGVYPSPILSLLNALLSTLPFGS